MGGILKFMEIEEAVVTATRAGSDLLEICHSIELILRAFEGLLAEAEKSAAFRRLLLQRATEVERKRARLYTGIPRRPTPKQFDELLDRVARFLEKVTTLSQGDSFAPRDVSPAERV
jgi:beta-N-acetylhexosaminidase